MFLTGGTSTLVKFDALCEKKYLAKYFMEEADFAVMMIAAIFNRITVSSKNFSFTIFDAFFDA